MGAGAGARGCGPHHPPVSRKSPARDESSFGCVVQTRQFFVRFFFEVCWLLSFFSPEVLVQGELVRARGFRSRSHNSALTHLAGCRARGAYPRGHLGRFVEGFWVCGCSSELALCVSESSRCVWVIFLRAGAVLPFIAILGESGPLFEVRWDVKRFALL